MTIAEITQAVLNLSQEIAIDTAPCPCGACDRKRAAISEYLTKVEGAKIETGEHHHHEKPTEPESPADHDTETRREAHSGGRPATRSHGKGARG